jgi:DNA-binding response OmpR family regulator
MQPQLAPYSKRILYIEDDNDTVEMVSLVLRAAKYHVTASDRIEQALREARNARFSLYLIDHTLTDGNGIQLCQELRQFDQETPIIFCSGYADDEHQIAARDSGAQAFLSKPFDTDQLLELIARFS